MTDSRPWTLLLVLVLLCAAPGSLQGRETNLLPGWSLSDHLLRLLPGLSIEQCLRECSLRPRCLSINHYSRAPWCFLNDASDVENPLDLVQAEQGFVYSSRHTWTQTVAPVVCQQCNSSSHCNPESPKNPCPVEECPAPVSVDYGRVLGNGVIVGNRVKHVCKHDPSLSLVATCLTNGSWSQTDLTCPGRDCVPAVPTNGWAVPLLAANGEDLSYGCDTGFDLVGTVTTSCDDGTILGPEPTCVAQSCSATSPTHGYATPATVASGSTVTYACASGYEILGDATRTCTNGVLTGNQPTCQPQGCSATSPTHGYATPAMVASGSTVTYACASGYEILGDATRTCTNGVLTGNQPTCQPQGCSATSPTHGYATPATVASGSTVTYACASGYEILGDATRTCTNGVLTGNQPTCQQQGCATTSPANGNVDTAMVSPGYTATYTCVSGYEINGDATRTCTNGVLTGSQPTCRAVSAYRIRMKGSDKYWVLQATTFTQKVKAYSESTSDLGRFYFRQVDNQRSEIVSAVTGKTLHANLSQDGGLNTEFQTTDCFSRFRIESQGHGLNKIYLDCNYDQYQIAYDDTTLVVKATNDPGSSDYALFEFKAA